MRSASYSENWREGAHRLGAAGIVWTPCCSPRSELRDRAVAIQATRPPSRTPKDIQSSCLQLGFYLASWGMLRGSSDLLQRSARHLVPVVQAIANMDIGLWEIDAHEYTEANIERLLEQARILRRANGSMSDTLVTKVMLGVFGSVPAFDTNVGRGFKRVLGISGFGPEALRRIGAFYHQNSELLDNYRVPTLEFLSGEPTERLYTRAKLIDMAFFVEGMPDAPGQSVEVRRPGQRASPAGVSRAAALTSGLRFSPISSSSRGARTGRLAPRSSTRTATTSRMRVQSSRLWPRSPRVSVTDSCASSRWPRWRMGACGCWTSLIRRCGPMCSRSRVAR